MSTQQRSLRVVVPALAVLVTAGTITALAVGGRSSATAAAASVSAPAASVSAAAASVSAPATAAPASPVNNSGSALLPVAGQGVRLVTAADGNEARYRVREQLARIEFPSDAVGSTSSVTGAIVLDAQGRIVRADSRFTVDLASISTDSDRRDNYVRRNTLKTEQFPTAVFVPVSFDGLPTPLPTSGEMTFQLTGDLTLHGNTRPVTWNVTARAGAGGYTGTARTQFSFSYFGIPVPRVASVLSVTETVRLEYDFRLVPR
jgi:polyisoprenoid-binding protein YceI